MTMYYEKLKSNPLRTKKELESALLALVEPLEGFLKTSKYGLKFETGGTIYNEKIREIEAVLRPLWGIIPFLSGGGSYAHLDDYLQKIIKGTDPQSDSYWGVIHDRDQRMVEMAVIGTALCIAKSQTWDKLSRSEQDNLRNWLLLINDYEVVPNNWLFFRILVNTGLRLCGEAYSQEKLDDDLASIDSYYIGEGWYSDGETEQIDYYIGFAIHFYAMIYTKVCEATDTLYVPKFKERAILFAQSFKAFFAKDGTAVAYGRSMTYRFAQSAFWAGAVFAGVEVLPLGELKYLLLNNLRHWFNQDIFTSNGELTIGYYYRNLIMSEGYNAYGSPYWALKSFIVLALEDNHPFWSVEEVEPTVAEQVLIKPARQLLQRNESGTEIQLFTVGQYCGFKPANGDTKYEKFVYSSTFGFSVSKGASLLQGAFDNTLAVSEQDDYYRVRYGVESYQVEETHLVSVWKPWVDVEITSIIVPCLPWHVRIHLVNSKRKLSLSDSGFSVDTEGDFEVDKTPNSVSYTKSNNHSQRVGIVNLMGDAKTIDITHPEPNTNLHFVKSAFPSAIYEVNAGEHVIATAVFGGVNDNAKFNTVPTVTKTETGFAVAFADKTITIQI